MGLRHFIILIALFCTTAANAQVADSIATVVDSTATNTGKKSTATLITDTTKNLVRADTIQSSAKPQKPFIFEPNPKKAGLYSAIFPGLGQIYNRQYWKVPLVYGLAGVAGYFIQDNVRNYRKYRAAYISRIDSDLGNDDQSVYSASQLKQLQDQYKQYLDISVLLTAVGYMGQIIDAVVYAHLKNFDVSRDISFRVTPLVTPYYAGIGMTMHIR